MDTETMLTTFDNPYNPFDDFDQWFAFDVAQGYYSCNLLARIAGHTEGLSVIEEKRDTERAIDEIIKYDFLNIYTTVTRDIESKETE